MTSISLINKTGQLHEVVVKESVDEIWLDINFRFSDDEINIARPLFNKDYLYLTLESGNKVIVSKKFIYTVK